MSTGVLIVCHSVQLATGVKDVAAQMGEGVEIRAAGGTDDDGIGTSLERVESGLTELLDVVNHVVVMYDLGSALMTAEWAIEAADDDVAQRISLIDGPLVEGAVAAVVAIAQGEDLDAIRQAVAETAQQWGSGDGPETETSAGAPADTTPLDSDHAAPGQADVRRTVTIHDPAGLHARPAARIATAAAKSGVTVTINGTDATSVLAMLSLGIAEGDELAVAATGDQADGVVTEIADIIAKAGQE